MNRSFFVQILERTRFPAGARDYLVGAFDMLAVGFGEDLDKAIKLFFDSDFNIELTDKQINRLADRSGISAYTVWLVLLLAAAEQVKPLYYSRYRDDSLFWDTFTDLRFKAVECKEVYGVWGCFVSFWYPIFFRGDIVKLGRLQFENSRCSFDRDHTFGGITVKNGDAVKSIHIPSSGEPFDADSRLESYRLAFALFCKESGGAPLVCTCDSWLLYPEYKRILPQGSNIRGFTDEFALVDRHDCRAFDDAWRIFGKEHDKPVDLLPERTALQRAFKRHLSEGGPVGTARGLLIFDGERILTASNL